MMRRDGGSVVFPGFRALAVTTLLLVAACSSNSGPDERATTARVRVDGTSPHPLVLVTAREFYEDIDPVSGQVIVVLDQPDTVQVTPPYDATVDLGTTGSVYVELRNLLVPTASIRLRVELDNGETFDRTATLSDDAALIYYFALRERSFR
jgi:hypothetical protein